MQSLLKFAGSVSLLLGLTAVACAQDANYDEAKIPKYELPETLVLENGDKVTDVAQWRGVRRPEIVKLFEEHVYGAVPENAPKDIHFGKPEVDNNALDGKAVRKQVKVYFSKDEDGPSMDLLIYLPKTDKPAPIFVGLNFRGNHATQDDPAIWLPTTWLRDRKDGDVKDNTALESGRGAAASRWPVEEIIARGYGVATIYCGDIDPDFHDKFQNGVHSLVYKEGEKPAPGEWGTIATWAWGLSRALDYFETDDQIDHQRVAVIGHSRLGKTSLWAGARDMRFAIVISNDSGCGGAALSRRRIGESVKRINTSFPHWFCENFKKYNDNEDALPVDQHMLTALVAPRPLYVASATGDQWADPKGEFLSAKLASPVYELTGEKGLSDVDMPEPDSPVMRGVGYHIRTGKHDITSYDWQRYMDFADQHYNAKKE